MEMYKDAGDFPYVRISLDGYFNESRPFDVCIYGSWTPCSGRQFGSAPEVEILVYCPGMIGQEVVLDAEDPEADSIRPTIAQ